jgi:hypothetical protein
MEKNAKLPDGERLAPSLSVSYDPKIFNADAIELFKSIFVEDPVARLCGGRDEHSEMRRAPFFKEINWAELEAQEVGDATTLVSVFSFILLLR